ncbi:MAG: AMP-dependent synthetase/ligase [Promethearchaeia archaeon]
MTRLEYGKAIIKYNEPKNLVSLFEEAQKNYSKNPLFGEKNDQGKYMWTTYAEIGARINYLRGGLSELGVEEGDTIGIIANNRAEWFIAENATHGLKARWVPMYQKELFETWKYIISDAEIKILFVANEDIKTKVEPLMDEITTLEKIIILEGSGEDSIKNLENLGKEHPKPAQHPDVDDIAVLIYTSGTTGDPKGVLLTHGNLTFVAQAGYHIYPELCEDSVSLSILPWAHSYGISAELHNFLQFGGSIGMMESVDTLADDMAAVKPTHLICVPRVFNKIHQGIWSLMQEEGGIKLKLFKAALKSAAKKIEKGKEGLKYKILDKLVLSKVRERFGGRLIAALTASAKMNVDVSKFFQKIGFPIYDCYGMTETAPAVTMNCPEAWKIGSVGKPIEKTKIVIDKSLMPKDGEDGEIMVFGPQVMKGYHKKPQKTAEVMVERDGIKGVMTGDLGHIDDEGYLHITGRIKEEYKLANGLYIHPTEIEQDIKFIPYIANTMVYGDGKAYNICLVVLDFPAFQQTIQEEGITITFDEFFQDSEKAKKAKRFVEEGIKTRLREKYGGYEIPKKFLFLKEDFTLDNEMLTQTMKVKRRKILEEYEEDIEALYS